MKSSPNSKRTKALDAIDKHIEHQNKRRKSSAYGRLSTLLSTISEAAQLQGVKHVSAKQTSPSPVKLPEGPAMIPSSPRYRKSCSPTRNSSPLTRKSVTFSDKLESSPPQINLSSSPHRENALKTYKPILKSPSGQSISPDGQMNKSSAALTQLYEFKPEICISPHNPEFWVMGEVHNVSDMNDLVQFRNIIEGGIRFLKPSDLLKENRDFEIYATLNNVVPIVTGSNNTRISNKKMDIVMEYLDELLQICPVHMVETQEKLLANQRKDPFVSRLYVQIIRFSNSLLSNFRIIKALEKKASQRKAFKQILDSSLIILCHPNSSKVMISAQIALLREEKFSALYFSEKDVQKMLDSILNMRYIDSSNLTYERLLLLKSFISKFPRFMVGNLEKWLPGEIILSILTSDETYSMKIATTCTSILLDTYKACLNSNDLDYGFLNAFPKCKTMFVFERKNNDYAVINNSIDFDDQLISDSLIERINDFINKKNDCKIGMDLWLATFGLFHLKRKLDESAPLDIEWLQPILLCFGLDQTAQGLALRSWRIVVYVVLAEPPKSEEQLAFISEILYAPFDKSFQARTNVSLLNSQIFLFNTLAYMLFCNPKLQESVYFNALLERVLKPLLKFFIASDCSLALFENVHKIFWNLLGFTDQRLKSTKSIFVAAKVIAANGIQLEDFLEIPPPNTEKICDFIIDHIFPLLSRQIGDTSDLCVTTALGVMKNLRKGQSGERKHRCLEFLLKSIPMLKQEPQRLFIMTFSQIFDQFDRETLLDKSVHSILCQLRKSSKQFGLDGSQLLKGILSNPQVKIDEFYLCDIFLSFGDGETRAVIQDITASDLVYQKANSSNLKSILKVISAVPTPRAIHNLFELCKTNLVTPEALVELDSSRWEDQDILLLIEYALAEEHSLARSKLQYLLEDVLFLHLEVLTKNNLTEEYLYYLLSNTEDFSSRRKNEIFEHECLVNEYVNLLRQRIPLSEEILETFLERIEDVPQKALIKLIDVVIESDFRNLIIPFAATIFESLVDQDNNQTTDNKVNRVVNKLLELAIKAPNAEQTNAFIQFLIAIRKYMPSMAFLQDNLEHLSKYADPRTLALILGRFKSCRMPLLKVMEHSLQEGETEPIFHIFVALSDQRDLFVDSLGDPAIIKCLSELIVALRDRKHTANLEMLYDLLETMNFNLDSRLSIALKRLQALAKSSNLGQVTEELPLNMNTSRKSEYHAKQAEPKGKEGGFIYQFLPLRKAAFRDMPNGMFAEKQVPAGMHRGLERIDGETSTSNAISNETVERQDASSFEVLGTDAGTEPNAVTNVDNIKTNDPSSRRSEPKQDKFLAKNNKPAVVEEKQSKSRSINQLYSKGIVLPKRDAAGYYGNLGRHDLIHDSLAQAKFPEHKEKYQRDAVDGIVSEVTENLEKSVELRNNGILKIPIFNTLKIRQPEGREEQVISTGRSKTFITQRTNQINASVSLLEERNAEKSHFESPADKKCEKDKFLNASSRKVEIETLMEILRYLNNDALSKLIPEERDILRQELIDMVNRLNSIDMRKT
ncbi:LAMI_0H11518g1_1 [Lachancea mirantina]|uniref:LAMI_0H11518g1_1 n=1 Tax=Lachancea mirantina TaxID=1230905 RepID=A0A1G4KH93_9SACH|nr:LAMI_0H11518g1_1 [Lachancea mirantina]